MNITMFHDLDTGFLAATLKPAFEALGHTCTVVQTLSTYLDTDHTHVDHLMNTMTDEQIYALKDIYKETDLFIIRSVSDFTLRVSGILPFLNKNNTIYRVHGSELRENNVPYSLRTWRIDWHNKEPLVVAPKDHSLLHFYRQNTITHIERPCAFDTFPRRKKRQSVFAITTPTNIARKGTQYLIDNWDSHIPLQVLHGTTRKEVLKEKAQASFYIDNVGEYNHGPYNMNSVEAWFYRIPVFSRYLPIDEALCPDLSNLIHNTTNKTVQTDIEQYIPDTKQLSYARKYALHRHDPTTIAQQYIHLLA